MVLTFKCHSVLLKAPLLQLFFVICSHDYTRLNNLSITNLIATHTSLSKPYRLGLWDSCGMTEAKIDPGYPPNLDPW